MVVGGRRFSGWVMAGATKRTDGRTNLVSFQHLSQITVSSTSLRSPYRMVSNSIHGMNSTNLLVQRLVLHLVYLPLIEEWVLRTFERTVWRRR
jgi:hypothetical protein